MKGGNQPIIWPKFAKTLHENDENLTTVYPKIHYVDPPLHTAVGSQCISLYSDNPYLSINQYRQTYGKTRKHSSSTLTARLPTISMWGKGVLKWTSLNMSSVMTTRCHKQEGTGPRPGPGDSMSGVWGVGRDLDPCLMSGMKGRGGGLYNEFHFKCYTI